MRRVTRSPTPFSVQDWSSKSPLPQAIWEKQLKAKINTCNMVIVLVGKSMGSALGVAKEIGFAIQQDVPLFGVYIDGAGTSTTLPKGLARNRTIAWDWRSIAKAVKQMMGEGKNK